MIAQGMNSNRSPGGNQLFQLDQQMRQLVDDASVPLEQKLQQYYNTLKRYQHVYKETYDKPVSVKVVDEDKQLLGKLPVSEVDLVNRLPKPKRQSAKLLLKYVQNNPNISWNNANELVLKGRRVPGSNIYDLITDISKDGRNRAPAIGWEEFTTSLIQQNIPKEAVGNATRWQYIRNKLAPGLPTLPIPPPPPPPPPLPQAPRVPVPQIPVPMPLVPQVQVRAPAQPPQFPPVPPQLPSVPPALEGESEEEEDEEDLFHSPPPVTSRETEEEEEEKLLQKFRSPKTVAQSSPPIAKRLRSARTTSMRGGVSGITTRGSVRGGTSGRRGQLGFGFQWERLY